MTKEYIEREAAIEAIMSDPPDAHYPQWYVDKIKSIPATGVAEVRHGRWIVFYSAPWKPKHSGEIPVFRKSYKCSECCRRTIIAENYCPNCGAIMDNDEVRSQCKVNYNVKKG